MKQLASVLIHCMQHLFGQLAQGLSIEFFIQFFNLFIFVTLAHLHAAITFIQASNACLASIIGNRQHGFRLSAATNAAAGTCHYFDKMILLFASLNALNHLAHICSTINNSDIYSQAIHIQASLTNALVATHRLQI